MILLEHNFFALSPWWDNLDYICIYVANPICHANQEFNASIIIAISAPLCNIIFHYDLPYYEVEVNQL